MTADAPYHAHIYYSDDERSAADALRDELRCRRPDILFVGQMTDRGVGPHPIPQFEIHFHEARSDRRHRRRSTDSGLRRAGPPADRRRPRRSYDVWRTGSASRSSWTLSVLDPPGLNQGVARFGKSRLLASRSTPRRCGNPRRIPGTSARTACNARGRASRTPPRIRRRRARTARASRAAPARSIRSGAAASLPVASQTSEQSRHSADALRHVHLLGRAGVGAAQAHPRAIHQVMRRHRRAAG